MKKKQCAKRFDSSDFDWTGYTEITGDDLYRINGGAKVENSDAGVAGAKPHDTITRDDGTTVELKEIDIKLAQEKLARQSSSTQTPASAAPAGASTPSTSATKPTTGRTTGNTGSSSGGSSSSSGSGGSSSSSEAEKKTETKSYLTANNSDGQTNLW